MVFLQFHFTTFEGCFHLSFKDFYGGFTPLFLSFSPTVFSLRVFNITTQNRWETLSLLALQSYQFEKWGNSNYAELDRMAAGLYNDDDFDSQSNKYMLEIFGEEATPEGYILGNFWQPGDAHPKTNIIDVRDSGDGTLEAILKRTAEDENTYEKTVFYQRCVFRPTELDGVLYFTLLSAVPIEEPSFE
jgi:hypothetical protein